MEKIGKFALIALVIGVGLLLFEMMFCFVALANMETIGNSTEYQNFVGGVLMASMGLIAISVLLGIIYAIANILENQ